jgi:diguanylate cyclase (GGDEF)-like protein
MHAEPHWSEPDRRTDRSPEPSVSHGFPPEKPRRSWLPLPRLFNTLLPFALLCAAFVAPSCAALDSLDSPDQGRHLSLASTTRPPGIHAAHTEIQAAHLWSLIEEVRFNQKPLPFEEGITVGPGAGDLEIQFAAPPSAASDHLRYRLLGFDKKWREAGKEASVLYSHLAPGRYEFDFQTADTAGLRGSVVQCIPITIVAPYWETARFRGLGIIVLLVVVLVLYKLRVGYLLKHNKKLQERVSQTRAELTLTAKIAGDAQEALKEQALKDSLTGLWNRRAIFAMLEREVYRAQRDHFPITLVMIDLDHFKNINDTYGHLTGDEVLREAASRLVDTMRPYDFAGRYGGEEFLVVLPSCSPQNGLQRAEHFRKAIAEKLVPTAVGPLAVTCSLGVAAYEEAMPPEDLIHRADEALYRAKRLGRNCVCSGY